MAQQSGLAAQDREMLGASVLKFAEQHYDFHQRPARIVDASAGRSPTWREMADLGILGLMVPAAQGGLGGSILDAGVVMDVIGRNLMVEPYLTTAILAAPLIAQLDPEGTVVDLDAVSSGAMVVALADREPDLGFARGLLGTRARTHGNGWILDGAKSFVLDGPVADVVLVSARDEDDVPGLFAVSAEAAASGIRALTTVDDRPLADIAFSDTPATRLGTGDVAPALSRALSRAVIALGFEAAGAMDVLVLATAEHLRTRRAFKGTLSQFQVLRHRLVDMFVATREVAALATATAGAFAIDPDGSEAQVSAMKVYMCRAARAVAEGAVQLHGGIGMTDELNVSHYFKRLMMTEALFGDTEHHLDRYVALTAGQ